MERQAPKGGAAPSLSTTLASAAAAGVSAGDHSGPVLGAYEAPSAEKAEAAPKPAAKATNAAAPKPATKATRAAAPKAAASAPAKKEEAVVKVVKAED